MFTQQTNKILTWRTKHLLIEFAYYIGRQTGIVIQTEVELVFCCISQARLLESLLYAQRPMSVNITKVSCLRTDTKASCLT